MHTAKTTTKRVATAIAVLIVAAIWLDLGARRTQAIQDSEDFPSPIGIARGQTLRITALNIGEKAAVGPEYRLLDSTGETLAATPEPHLIPAGSSAFLTLPCLTQTPGPRSLRAYSGAGGRR